MRTEQVPVLVVGGGGAGLTASMLLSTYGVQHLLVSATPTTSILPKAHVLNQRTMEAYTDVGVADEIYAIGTPPEQMSHTAWYLGIAGHADAGRLIHKMECWDGGYTDPAWVTASPCRQTNLPQIRLEPVLKRLADELNPNGIRFHNELLSLEQDAEGVTATIKDHASAETYQVRARYLLGCDGGRTVGRLVGAELEGSRDLQRSATIHMTADLSHLQQDDDVLIRWILHPQFGGSQSVLVPMGPTHWGPKSEEWVFHMSYAAAAEALFDTDEKVMALLRERVGVPDFNPTVHIITRWQLVGLVAKQTKIGRVFLLGDASHRHPPTGGLGLTSAVHDVYNLCWKIAHVLDGRAGEALLDSCHPERFPAFERNVQRSVENALNHFVLMASMGISADLTADECLRNARQLWESGPEGDARRAIVMRAMASQSMEFKEHNVEIGFRCQSAAVIDDGTPVPANPDDIRIYEPDTRPGSPLPHAWVEREGERKALRQVAPPGSFTLIAGESGDSWCQAAETAARARGIELKALRLGHTEGDWLDPRLAFIRRREFGPEGAILVRPDRVIAWRSMGAEPDAERVIGSALDLMLARS